jgi:hypothetical protein
MPGGIAIAVRQLAFGRSSVRPSDFFQGVRKD